MNEFLESLNLAGKYDYKEYKKLRELDLKKRYKIISVDKIKIKDYYEIYVELEDYKIKLPKIFLKIFNENNINLFNDKIRKNKYYISIIIDDIKYINNIKYISISFEYNNI